MPSNIRVGILSLLLLGVFLFNTTSVYADCQDYCDTKCKEIPGCEGLTATLENGVCRCQGITVVQDRSAYQIIVPVLLALVIIFAAFYDNITQRLFYLGFVSVVAGLLFLFTNLASIIFFNIRDESLSIIKKSACSVDIWAVLREMVSPLDVNCMHVDFLYWFCVILIIAGLVIITFALYRYVNTPQKPTKRSRIQH